MSGNESLEGIGTEARAVRTREEGSLWSAALLRYPFLEHRSNIRAQRRASHFPTLSEATDVSANAELHILVSKQNDLTVAQTRLDGNKQERSVPPADPCPGIGSCQEDSGLFLCEKLNWATLIALGRNGKDALTV
jgi:hypothetical protein